MRYIANPVVVEALRIIEEGSAVAGALPYRPGSGCEVRTEDGVLRHADAGMIARYYPKVGDYWVIQADGYEYINPKEVFERKYRPDPMIDFHPLDLLEDSLSAGQVPDFGAIAAGHRTQSAEAKAELHAQRACAPKHVDITRAHGRSPELEAAIQNMFESHMWNASQVRDSKRIREALAAAVMLIVELVPPCPDRTVAIRKLREARMDVNSAITHNGKY